MSANNARENTLKKIANALRETVGMPYKELNGSCFEFSKGQDGLEARFAKEFGILRGRIIPCLGKQELLDNLLSLITGKGWQSIDCQIPSVLKLLQLGMPPSSASLNAGNNDTEVGITGCECLIARTGSILLSAAQSSGRILPVYAPVHVVIAYVSQLVFDINDAIDHIRRKFKTGLPSALFFASGPSRTGDIERTLVIGVHGPIEVYVFLVDDTGLTN